MVHVWAHKQRGSRCHMFHVPECSLEIVGTVCCSMLSHYVLSIVGNLGGRDDSKHKLHVVWCSEL